MDEPASSDIPEGLTEAAKKERERFMTQYKKMMEKSCSTALTILVWGPNPESDDPVARKRKQIKEKLIELGHNAMFSEDCSAADRSEPQSSLLSLKAKEYAQAKSAHLIILLDASPGALAEAHDFCNDPDIAPNMYVMVPQKYKGKGYSTQGAIQELEDAYHNVFWYEQDDIEKCNVQTKAVKCAEARRQILFRAGKL